MMCSGGRSTCSITPDGWVVPCELLGNFRAGNVRDRDILDIWNTSPELTEIRRIAVLTMKDVAECASCGYTTVCGGGCRGMHTTCIIGSLRQTPIALCGSASPATINPSHRGKREEGVRL